ncbi:DUF5367 family protein [Paenalkalicoccus suaedae]|uniref:DUF5367 family protein n=1 Tax=Paenalkalicoccus suaedae TaxID=2592382 RepID=A0A859FIV3_9BACI|nr:DUF5367 family protein [Paenalkalicoccus suaedae]QKS72662.1 DUF5367 family protein [Paenalkalicoccus suaedae]
MSNTFTKQQTTGLVILGVVFWFTAALMVQFTGDFFFNGEAIRITMAFLLAIPVLLFFLAITIAALRIERNQTFEAVSIMTMVALLLDGLAMAFFRELYHSSYQVSHYGASWIMWGAGMGLLIAYIRSKT